MSKTTKPERKALFALEDAAAAARFAKKAAKTLPTKQAKKLRELAKDAKDASDASKKSIRKDPEEGRQACRQGHRSRADRRRDGSGSPAEEGGARRRRSRRAERKAAEKKAAAKKAAPKAAPKKAAAEEPAAEPVLDDPELAATITELAPISEAVDQPAEVVLPEPLSSLSVAALRARARDQGRTGYSRLTKAQLVDSSPDRDRRSAPEALDRAAQAPAPRTLIDILRETTARHPEASALDDGSGALSYRELMARRRADRGAPARRRCATRRSRRRARRLGLEGAVPLDPRRSSPPVRPTFPSTRTTPTSGRGSCSARPASRASSRTGASTSPSAAHGCRAARLSSTAATRTRARTAIDVVPPPRSTTTRGSSSRPDRPACRRASPCRTAPRRHSSTPRRGSSCRMPRSAPATGCSPVSRSPSTPRAKRCGSRGGTARASFPRRVRSCDRARTSPRG